jgi:hypothetical protein
MYHPLCTGHPLSCRRCSIDADALTWPAVWCAVVRCPCDRHPSIKQAAAARPPHIPHRCSTASTSCPGLPPPQPSGPAAWRRRKSPATPSDPQLPPATAPLSLPLSNLHALLRVTAISSRRLLGQDAPRLLVAAGSG